MHGAGCMQVWLPSGHITSKRYRIDVDATSLCRIDVNMTSLRCHVPAGYVPTSHSVTHCYENWITTSKGI